MFLFTAFRESQADAANHGIAILQYLSIAACNYQPFVLKGFPWVFLCSPSIQGTCKRQLQDSQPWGCVWCAWNCTHPRESSGSHERLDSELPGNSSRGCTCVAQGRLVGWAKSADNEKNGEWSVNCELYISVWGWNIIQTSGAASKHLWLTPCILCIYLYIIYYNILWYIIIYNI